MQYTSLRALRKRALMLFSLSKAARLLREDSLRLLSHDSHVSMSPCEQMHAMTETGYDTIALQTQIGDPHEPV